MVLRPEKRAEAESIFPQVGARLRRQSARPPTPGAFVIRHGGRVQGRPADQGARRRRPPSTTARGRRPRSRPCSTAPQSSRRLPTDAALVKLLARRTSARSAGCNEQYDSLILATRCRGGRRRRRHPPLGRAKASPLTTAAASAIARRTARRRRSRRWRRRGATSSPSAAKPLALTDNLNFGNPEKPHAWASSSAPSPGIADAAKALDFPDRVGQTSRSTTRRWGSAFRRRRRSAA